MINLQMSGSYKLLETSHDAKVLYLNGDCYAWSCVQYPCELTLTMHQKARTDCLLGMGRYRLYDVDDEPALSDLFHLELEVGNDIWQGYLLADGLPGKGKERAKIAATRELITTNPVHDIINVAVGGKV